MNLRKSSVKLSSIFFKKKAKVKQTKRNEYLWEWKCWGKNASWMLLMLFFKRKKERDEVLNTSSWNIIIKFWNISLIVSMLICMNSMMKLWSTSGVSLCGFRPFLELSQSFQPAVKPSHFCLCSFHIF